MKRTHDVLTAYCRMCLWMHPFGYSEFAYHEDVRILMDPISSKGFWLDKCTDAAELIAMRHAWLENAELMDEICEARSITRRRFLESLACPKPGTVENIVYASELRNHFGDISDVPGFNASGVFVLPKGHGVLVPHRMQGMIAELRFYTMGELLRSRLRKAA